MQHSRSTRLKFTALIAASLASTFTINSACAQHSDIEFGYVNEKIHIAPSETGLVFDGDFATSGAFEQFTSNPGFATNGDKGLIANGLDVIDFNVLGPLEFHNGLAFSSVPSNANIVVEENPAGLGLLVIDALSVGPISGPGAIGQAASNGSVHEHIRFELNPRSLDTSDFGAYGLLMELVTSDTNIANSDPFYIVFNFGLDEASFGRAMNDFAAQVPEPTAFRLAAFAFLLAVHRRFTSSAHQPT